MKSTKERFARIKKIGFEKDRFEDLYHSILTMNWFTFISYYIITFLVFNIFFGFLYWIDHGGISNTNNDFFMNFSFSVQTFSTIGYGVFAPSNVYSHAIVVIESVFGVLFTALLTGLAFAKFSRATARIIFADKVVITNFNNKPTLMFRLVNLRANQIAEASIKAVVLKTVVTAEGHQMRLQQDIEFVRSTSSFFILSWTVMHVIDEKSPLYNLTSTDLIDKNIEMSVSVIGHDETFSQSVHTSCIYSPEDFNFNRSFEDILMTKDGIGSAIDLTKFNDLKPISEKL